VPNEATKHGDMHLQDVCSKELETGKLCHLSFSSYALSPKLLVGSQLELLLRISVSVYHVPQAHEAQIKHSQSSQQMTHDRKWYRRTFYRLM